MYKRISVVGNPSQIYVNNPDSASYRLLKPNVDANGFELTSGVMIATTNEDFMRRVSFFVNELLASPDFTSFGIGDSYTGSKPAIPVHYFHDKVEKGSANFKKECLDGKIVSHPYEVYSGFIRAKEHWVDTKVTTSTVSPLGHNHALDFYRDRGYLLNISYLGSTRSGLRAPGDEYAVRRTDPKVYLPLIRTESYLSQPHSIRSSVVESFVTGCNSALKRMDDAIITDTLAKANDKEIDLLTTLAEMPKTIVSVLEGFRLLAEMTQAAKKRELELTKSHSKLMLRQRNLANVKEKDALRNQRSKRKRDYSAKHKRQSDLLQQKFGSEQSVELVDAITGVWMNYRYNIRPIVYTIQDSVSAIEKWKNQYLTVRSVHTRDFTPPEISGFTFEGTSKITHRCWIKRRYDVSDDWNKFTKVVMGDIFVTAYELIPVWSIVADWFFNVGPALRAASYTPTHLQERATYSVKVEVDGVYTNDSDPTESYDVRYTGYKRQTISPSGHISLRYVNEFDDLKGYDSLSFLWASIRKPVKNIPAPYRRR